MLKGTCSICTAPQPVKGSPDHVVRCIISTWNTNEFFLPKWGSTQSHVAVGYTYVWEANAQTKEEAGWRGNQEERHYGCSTTGKCNSKLITYRWPLARKLLLSHNNFSSNKLWLWLEQLCFCFIWTFGKRSRVLISAQSQGACTVYLWEPRRVFHKGQFQPTAPFPVHVCKDQDSSAPQEVTRSYHAATSI